MYSKKVFSMTDHFNKKLSWEWYRWLYTGKTLKKLDDWEKTMEDFLTQNYPKDPIDEETQERHKK